MVYFSIITCGTFFNYYLQIPDTMCFDTPYHLTYEGCAYRTQLVIEDIDRILKKE